MAKKITVEITVHAPMEKIWEYWTQPEHIKRWYYASDDWWAPSVTNDFRVDGKFNIRMEAKDGSDGFDLGGTYTAVNKYELIEYTLGDGRRVEILFAPKEGECEITEVFDAEDKNVLEVQKSGWQSILNNFKKYMEK